MRQMPSQHYTEIKRSFYHHGLKRTALDGCVEAMKGVYSSMRLCQIPGSFGNSTGLAVNVDVANGTFWIAQTLHQAARNLCDIRHRHISYMDFRNMLKPARMNDGNLTRSDPFKHLRKMSKLRFSVRHRGKESESKTYTIKDFCFDQKYGPEGGHAKNVKFMLKDKKRPDAPPVETSVYDYFKRQYNIDLEFWYLPLVKTERDGTFPMEVCHILENQTYKYKTDPEQVSYDVFSLLNLR
jgi:eukaryotic translation initiation factor 2C